MNQQWIQPEWPVPANVRALITTRPGGVSRGPYGVPPGEDDGMNLGLACGDDAAAVIANRTRLRAHLPSEPCWLHQVHGAQVVDAARRQSSVSSAADASFTDAPNVVCVVSIADCMPVLIADIAGRCVGVAHAGWRGLAAGIVQATVRAIRQRLARPDADLVAYLGPAIGPRHFEVGRDVFDAMHATLPSAGRAFVPAANGKFLADLPALGRQALESAGVIRIYGGQECTFSDPTRFYSFRRDRITGRHAALIWRV